MDDDDLLIDRRMTLRASVEDKLRGAIASGRFKPGQRMIEREMCELLGVGRTSIREAFRQLEAEGLITNVPHRGPSVSTISTAEAKQLYAVRALLEGFAGRCFAERRRPEDLAALKKALQGLKLAARRKDGRDLIEAKSTFYNALMEGSGNRFAKQMLTSLHNRIILLRMKSMAQPGRRVSSISEIEGIYEAIRDGDPDAAETRCRNHIEQAKEAALIVLADEVDEDEPQPKKAV